MFFSPFSCTYILIAMSLHNCLAKDGVGAELECFFLPFCSTCIHIEMSAHNLALRQTVSGQGFMVFLSVRKKNEKSHSVHTPALSEG